MLREDDIIPEPAPASSGEFPKHAQDDWDLFDQVPVPFHELDSSGVVRRVNRAECKLLGYETAAQMIGKFAWDFVAPEERNNAELAVKRKLSRLQPLRPFRRSFLRKDDSFVNLEIYESLVFDAAGQVSGIRSVLIDITAQQLAEEASARSRSLLEAEVKARTAELTAALQDLKKSEETFRLLFHSNPHPMWVYESSSLQFLEVNNAAVSQYGYSRDEFLRLTVADIRPPEQRKRFLEYLNAKKSGLRSAGEWQHLRKDGSLLTVRVSTHDIEFEDRPAVLTLAIDVTEQKSIEQQLRQAQKMEAVGRLAGGVAHDFNNLLTVIGGYAQMILQDLHESHPLHGSIEQVVFASNRAAALTKQLLAFSRQQLFELRVLSLNDVVKGVDVLAKRLIGEDIEVLTHMAPEIPPVQVDPNQMEQVLLNLIVNARDAMPDGGKIVIETGMRNLDPEFIKAHPGSHAGLHAWVAISDTGCGMDADTQTKIFEPFFTTKAMGKGTGLGLSTVYGIVKQHGGYVWVYSEPARGSTFKVYIPVALEPQQQVQRVAGPDYAGLSGTETILLVEDEPTVRSLAERILANLGYQVLTACDGREALEKGRSYGDRISLLLTDVIMPGCSGREVASQMSAFIPGLRVVFTSGYTGEAVVHLGELAYGDAFIQKPFSPVALAAIVRKALDGTAV